MKLESKYCYSLFTINCWLKAVILFFGANSQVTSENTFRVKAHKAVLIWLPASFLTSSPIIVLLPPFSKATLTS